MMMGDEIHQVLLIMMYVKTLNSRGQKVIHHGY